ncbi:zinc finger protein 120-like [Cavia porcellus]|uniref:zinc finger protein 120-like n=1 Tax=Cavia porcellus TaxID=10141 RepID=UPI002FE1ED89
MGETFRNMTMIGGLGDIQEAEKEGKIYWSYLRKLGKSYGHTSWNQCKEAFLGTEEGNVNVKETETHDNVQIHEKYCSGGKPYVCKQCRKGFTTHGICKKHERIHRGKRPYICDQCGKAFTARTYCQVHERLHSGEKHYECKHCEKAFSTCTYCVIHEKIHTGQKSHICKKCGKAFSRKIHFQIHENVLEKWLYC